MNQGIKIICQDLWDRVLTCGLLKVTQQGMIVVEISLQEVLTSIVRGMTIIMIHTEITIKEKEVDRIEHKNLQRESKGLLELVVGIKL